VDDLNVADAEHGVMISKAIFAGRFENRKALQEGIKTIGTREMVKVVSFDRKKKEEIWAKVDTGAWRTSIDKTLAGSLGLLEKENVLWEKKIKTSMGIEKRPVINLTFYLAERKVNTIASIANREGLKRLMIIGRRDLAGFLIRTEGFTK
jgi:hypothetical protein